MIMLLSALTGHPEMLPHDQHPSRNLWWRILCLLFPFRRHPHLESSKYVAVPKESSPQPRPNPSSTPLQKKALSHLQNIHIPRSHSSKSSYRYLTWSHPLLDWNKRNSSALDAIFKKVSGIVVGIACSGVHGLRDACVNALMVLASVDPDVVMIWLLLADVHYSRAKTRPSPPPASLKGLLVCAVCRSELWFWWCRSCVW